MRVDMFPVVLKAALGTPGLQRSDSLKLFVEFSYRDCKNGKDSLHLDRSGRLIGAVWREGGQLQVRLKTTQFLLERYGCFGLFRLVPPPEYFSW